MKLSFTPHAASALAAVALLLAGCGTVASSPTPAPRPSTTATVEIVAPASGAIVEGASAHVVLKLTGARIITETTTDIRPDEGHVHLYVNGLLVSMNYGLEQDIPVQPGTLVIKAEFVAADHVPFSPRVWSAENVFTVRR
jgi:hypothetical protein